jgi:hypothetical protein
VTVYPGEDHHYHQGGPVRGFVPSLDRITPSENLSEQQAELMEWWRGVTEADIDKMLPKVTEYGAYDLSVVGSTLVDMLPWDQNTPERVKQEVGCFFYLLGKMARMASAYKEGRLPSDDTLHDIVVYAMMIRRIRDRGEWG